MTTGQHVLEVAEQVRADGEVHRLPPYGFDAPVSIQAAPPYEDGRYVGTVVQHCGLAQAFTLTKAGLVLGRDFPDPAYSPTLAQQLLANFNDGGPPKPADLATIDWQGGGFGDTADTDHVVLIVGTDNWPDSVRTLEYNTDDYGGGAYYERPVSLLTSWGTPRYSNDPASAPSARGPEVGTVAGRIYAWAKAQGFTDAGVAGMLGNFQQESSIDPSATEGGCGWGNWDDAHQGGGLAQWSWQRRIDFADYAAAQGKPWDDLDLQLDWIIEEGRRNPQYQAAIDAMKAATDPEDAAYEWERLYEGAAVKGPRGQYAVDQMSKIQSGAYSTGTATIRPGLSPAARVILALTLAA